MNLNQQSLFQGEIHRSLEKAFEFCCSWFTEELNSYKHKQILKPDDYQINEANIVSHHNYGVSDVVGQTSLL